MEYNDNLICHTTKDNIDVAFKCITQNNNVVAFEVVGNVGNDKIIKKYNDYSSGIIAYNKMINK